MKYGPETATVEAFIQHLKTMTPEQWAAARGAARAAAGAAARAASEIQGAALMRERGQPFFFLPTFGFADPEAVISASRSAG